jgi:hypothetical protein
MLWTILVVLAILCLLSFSLQLGGSLIHRLLVVACVIFIINLVGGRRSSAWGPRNTDQISRSLISAMWSKSL